MRIAGTGRAAQLILLVFEVALMRQLVDIPLMIARDPDVLMKIGVADRIMRLHTLGSDLYLLVRPSRVRLTLHVDGLLEDVLLQLQAGPVLPTPDHMVRAVRLDGRALPRVLHRRLLRIALRVGVRVRVL